MSSSSNREACAAAIGKERCVWKTSNQVRDRDPGSMVVVKGSTSR